MQIAAKIVKYKRNFVREIAAGFTGDRDKVSPAMKEGMRARGVLGDRLRLRASRLSSPSGLLDRDGECYSLL
jgi:hypothetical protein